LKPPVRKVGRGRPQRYTDTFVEALLVMRVALRLPYRVLEGAARAIFQSHGLDPEQVPDHTLLCKRQSQLAPRLPAFRPGEHTCLIGNSNTNGMTTNKLGATTYNLDGEVWVR
ncbi:MAG: transposase, partial [Macromonas sp.]